jgi:negative regulator of flagellin synthesis FlgM
MRKDATMINAVGPTGITRTNVVRSEGVAKNEAVSKVDSTDAQASGAVTTAAGELASQGAPIDTAKVASIREAIANGTYKVDAKAIAKRMIELDLPTK